MRPDRLAVPVVAALLLAVGCTAPAADAPPEVTPAASSPTQPSPLPSATPTPSPTASTAPSPSATTPASPRDPDTAGLRKALVTAADLGRPWVAVDTPPDTDEACPGEPSAVSRLPFRATARRDLTRGAGELVNGASFRLTGLAGVDAAEVRAAWAADTSACRQHTDGDDYYVDYRAVEPAEVRGAEVRGADEVLLRRVERVYFDRGDAEPAYARHTLVVRTGRVVATVTYSFLPAGSDPEAEDFGAATALLQTQLGKTAKALAE
jgi:hypothetical protein